MVLPKTTECEFNNFNISTVNQIKKKNCLAARDE